MRPALHLAFAVARNGVMGEPAMEPPRLLRPFLHFVKLPDQALVAVRRALEEDAGFRARVTELAGDDLGRAPWLFLNRPEGWEDELARFAADEQATADTVREAKEERTAVRRLAQAEQAVERAERAAAKSRREAAAATAELAEERKVRRAADQRAAALAQRVEILEEESARGRKKAAEAKLDLSRWRAKVAQLEEQVSRAAARPSFDTASVGRAITAAEEALKAVRRAVEDEETRVELGAGDEVASPAPALSTDLPRPSPAPRRRPTSLPPAIFEDSTLAAAHLVRVPGILVLVDGYNLAKSLWPAISPEELRQRLVDALSELSARTGADIHVVFDGAELGGSVARPGGRLPVRVTFSPAAIEADDVILALVDDVPLARPVVVASSDRRVQEGARWRGANVLSSAQLGQVMGR